MVETGGVAMVVGKREVSVGGVVRHWTLVHGVLPQFKSRILCNK